MATIPKLTPDPNEIRDSFLRSIKNGLFNIGITNANVSRGSDYWVIAESIAAQISFLNNYVELQASDLMPDTTAGVGLDRWLAIVGLSRRPAGGSTGSVIFKTDYPLTLVPLGAELTSANGKRYVVTQGGSYATNAIIPVASVDLGADTNLEITEVLAWSSAPFGAAPTVDLSVAMTGGVDAEGDELAQERLLDRLAHAPASANAQWIIDLCERIDPSVHKAFVYAAANGPSTVHIALAGTPAIGTKSRVIDATKLNSKLRPTIRGNMPEYVETVVTSVEDVSVDCAFKVTLPLSVSTSSELTGPGTGTGWLDASPFPVANESTHFFCPVTGVADSSNVTVDSPAGFDPTAGVTHIQWIDRSTWTVKTATINSFTGTGPYVLTLSVPFVGVAVGDWLFPASVGAQTYIDAILSGFEKMGPGEKVSTAVQAISARHPRQTESFPSTISGYLLRALTSSSEEIQATDYFYRSTATPAVVDDATKNVTVTPATPALIADAPKIFIPRQLGIYPNFPLN